MNINKSRKGEVASLLAIVSMVMVGLGLFVGTQLARQTSPIQKDPFAQSIPQEPPAVPTYFPTNLHNDICFPGGSIESPITDPYCRSRIFPPSFADVDLGDVGSNSFELMKKAYNKPNIHIERVGNTFEIFGSFCVERSGGTTGRNFKLGPEAALYLSLNAAEKTVDENGNISASSRSRGGIIGGQTPIASANLYDPSKPSSGLIVADPNEDICTFEPNTPSTTPAVPLPDKSRYDSYRNPILFKINLSKQNSPLQQRIEELKRLAAEGKPIDKSKCSVYVHFEHLGKQDTYNLVGIPLELLVDEETAKTIKELCEPQVTPPEETPSPPTSTPSNTPPVPSPTVAVCYQNCSADESKVICGNDPTSEPPVKMKCYQVSGGFSNPRFPTGMTDSTSDESDYSREARLGLKVDGPCETNSVLCRCLPARCEDPAKDCSSQPLACTIPTITEVQRPSDTPIPTPSETPIPQACTFKSLAFINECTSYIFETDDKGNDRLVCTKISPFDTTSVKNSYQRNGKHLFGASNNLQLANVGKGRGQETVPVDRLRIKGVYEDPIYSTFRNYLDSDRYSITRGPAAGGVVTGRLWNITPFNIPAGMKLDDRSIKINPDPRSNFQAEIYSNGDLASVRLDINSEEYKVVPNGAWYQSMEYGIPANKAPMQSRYSSCVNKNYGTYQCATPADSAESLQEISGLPVQCGEDIEYGWTIMKCRQDVDYVFVVDVSTSMNLPEVNYSGTKLDVIKEQILKYIGNIKDNNSRISVITFGRSVAGKLDFTNNLQQAQSYVQSIPATPGGVNREGTCIDCGANEALRLVNARSDVSRNPVVIFMTDGIPTWRMGDNQSGTAGFCQSDYSLCLPAIQAQVNNLRAVAGLTLASVGYGKIPANDQEVNFNLQLLKVIDMLGQEGWKFSTNSQGATDLYKGKIAFAPVGEIYTRISERLNSCKRADLASAKALKSKDINGDGIINSIEYFLIIDSYFKEGNNLKEDINGDKVVNAMDLSEILRDFGTVIPTGDTGNQVEENVQ